MKNFLQILGLAVVVAFSATNAQAATKVGAIFDLTGGLLH